jgi:hypothetical protein
MTDKERIELAAYIADYVAYELDKQPHGLDITTDMIADAIDAYIGGAR